MLIVNAACLLNFIICLDAAYFALSSIQHYLLTSETLCVKILNKSASVP
jgi:hypothetical protein